MKSILIAILLVSPLCGQTSNVVDEAKAKISKQKHEVMVEHAKKLLERKTELEAEMADVDAKLAKLAEGKDVKMGEGSGISNVVSSSNCCISGTSSGCVTTSSPIICESVDCCSAILK